MKHGVAKRALGIVMTSAMVAGTVGTAPLGNWNKSAVDTVLAAGQSAMYVDSTDYYNAAYDKENAYTGDDLGCTYTKEKTVFKVWSPEADSMTLNLYATGSDKEEGAKDLGNFSMKKTDKGVWEYTYEGDLKNTYYTYRAMIDGMSYGETVDPYAKAAGVNGERGMVVDLDSTDPSGWDTNYKRTATNLSDIVVWEVHIRDFSIDVSSGVSAENRGKYKAFTESTTVNGEGKVSSCVDYLKKMGVTHVQLLPMFDYGGIDETKTTNELSDSNYNWGYNPVNYNVPEGSYSSNPYDGNTRIKEMKQMIQALHDAGIKVIMDVVYNHTYETGTSCFSKLMPDYYYKLTTDSAGNVVYNDESGCGNATRSGAAMYDKYMRDSLKYWVSEYNIDGFRFDLMGIHDAKTMNNIRKDMDENFGDDTIVLYGEGWTGGGYSKDSAYKEYCRNLDDGIGYFNDQIRDAIKGETGNEKVSQIGFAQQNYGLDGTYTDHEKFPTSVFGGIMGSVGKNTSNWWMWRAYWADTSNRVLSYDSCHDNMTVWDKFVQSMGVKDFSTTDNRLLNMSRMTAGYLLTSHGGTFLHAGEEFARTKNGNENSYNAGDSDNKLDWNRISSYGNLTDYYQGMIAIRKAFSGFRNILTETGDVVEENTASGFFNKVNGNNITNIPEFTEVVEGKNENNQIQSTVNSIGYYLSNDVANEWNQVAVLMNNTTTAKTAQLTATDGSQEWVLVSDGKQASVTGIATSSGSAITVPGKSVVVAVPKKAFDSVKFTGEDKIIPITEEDKDEPIVSPEPTKEPEVTPAPVTPSAIKISKFTVTPTTVKNGSGTVKMSVKMAASTTDACEYRFYVYKGDVLVKSSAWSEKDNFEWKATKAGTYTIVVRVRDTAGNMVSAEKTVSVFDKLTVKSVKADKKVVKKGKNITFTVKATGGKTAYKYSFKVVKTSGKIVKKSNTISSGKWIWKATQKGTYNVKVTVKDKFGATVTKTIKIVVK